MSDEYFEAESGTGLAEGAPAPVWELSGWWRRVGASMIDSLILWIPISILVSIAGIGGETSADDTSIAGNIDVVGWLIFWVVSSIYFMWTMSAWNGQTVGKRVTGIRVVRENGEPIDAKFAFVRQTLVISILFDTLGIILLFIPTILNYLWPLWDEKHQALHDKIVHSRVVRDVAVTNTGGPEAVQPPSAPFPVGTVPPPPAPAATVPPAPPAPPAPPTPGGTSTPYTPPPGFENPVPDDD